MKVTKTFTVEYEVEPLALKWHMTVGNFIATRRRLGIDSEGYDKCFICDTQLADNFEPGFISVKGVGNMFVCDKCMNRVIQESGGNSDDTSSSN